MIQLFVFYPLIAAQAHPQNGAGYVPDQVVDIKFDNFLCDTWEGDRLTFGIISSKLRLRKMIVSLAASDLGENMLVVEPGDVGIALKIVESTPEIADFITTPEPNLSKFAQHFKPVPRDFAEQIACGGVNFAYTTFWQQGAGILTPSPCHDSVRICRRSYFTGKKKHFGKDLLVLSKEDSRWYWLQSTDGGKWHEVKSFAKTDFPQFDHQPPSPSK